MAALALRAEKICQHITRYAPVTAARTARIRGTRCSFSQAQALTALEPLTGRACLTGFFRSGSAARRLFTRLSRASLVKRIAHET
jgi:hypothetical protein